MSLLGLTFPPSLCVSADLAGVSATAVPWQLGACGHSRRGRPPLLNTCNVQPHALLWVRTDAPAICKSVSIVIAQVRNRLPEAGDPRVRNKLAALLQHAARGVAANPTAAPADLLLFCHGVLEDGVVSAAFVSDQHWPFDSLVSVEACQSCLEWCDISILAL